MSAWSQLVSVALLGTARREPPADGPLAIERETPEAALLARAGALAVYRAAGARAAPAPRGDAPAPPETLPRCSPRAAAMLAVILDGIHAGVLDEWLELAARRALRVPEELLPPLLSTATGVTRRLALPALGERGRWLAAHNDDWAWAAGGDAVWETGSLTAREAWLEAERERDAGGARETLEAGWAQEDPRARAALLARLRTGLGAADEPFLERALDDRRQEVRAVASELLSALPGSALGERAAARARGLLVVQGGLRKRLEASLPEALDEAAARDVVHVKPPRGFGERAWWLRRLLALAPLAIWEPALGRGPDDLAGMPVHDHLENAVRGGWADAAVAQRDRAWAAALFPRIWDPELAAVLEPADAEREIARHAGEPAARSAREGLRAPYGLEVSRALLRHMPLDRTLALALAPAILDELPDDAPRAAAGVLAFRHDLHQELA